MEFLHRIRESMDTPRGRAVAVALSLTAVAGAITIAIVFWPTGVNPDVANRRKQGRPIPVYCKACNWSGTTNVQDEQKYPVACPKCGEEKAFEARRCYGCKELFAMPEKLLYSCPRCGYKYDDRKTPPGGLPPMDR